jgi:7-cyano-7-deazaguanine synthase
VVTAARSRPGADPAAAAVILHSGGIDAMALAYRVAREGRHGAVHGLHFDLGLPASAGERRAAEECCRALGFSFAAADLSWWRRLLAESLPAGERAPERVAAVFRARQAGAVGTVAAGILIGAAYAELQGGAHLYHALNRDDLPRYPYAPPVFTAVAGLLSLTGRPFLVHAPWLATGADEVLAEAVRLGAPVERAWSCTAAGDLHCGDCAACRGRRERFRRYAERHPGFCDRTRYARRPP